VSTEPVHNSNLSRVVAFLAGVRADYDGGITDPVPSRQPRIQSVSIQPVMNLEATEPMREARTGRLKNVKTA
jgi:hypothetical protein